MAYVDKEKKIDQITKKNTNELSHANHYFQFIFKVGITSKDVSISSVATG